MGDHQRNGRTVIRLEHADMPAGMRATVRQDGHDLVITVATWLPGDAKRATVRVAKAAAMRTGRLRHQLMPPAVWLPLAAGAVGAVVQRLLSEATRAHIAVAAGAVATAAAVTVAVVAVAPQQHLIALKPVPPIMQTHHPRRVVPAVRPSRLPKRQRPGAPVKLVAQRHPSSGSGQVVSSTPAPTSAPSPAVSVSVSASVPPVLPSPSSSPSTSAAPTCLTLLGVTVCV